MEDKATRRKHKEDARLKKRKRIQEGGGTRPRNAKDQSDNDKQRQTKSNDYNANDTATKDKSSKSDQIVKTRFTKSKSNFQTKLSSAHRFGRVMENVPCRNKPRKSTLSIAIPGSVLANCQTRELRTLLVGQIARAATIYHVDEIIVFDDKLSSSKNDDNNYFSGKRQQLQNNKRNNNETSTSEKQQQQDGANEKNHFNDSNPPKRSDHHTFMARLLQYCECPQYLRRHFFPMHPDLQFAGLLAPIDAPHHVRAEDRSKYREGVVLDKKRSGTDSGSLVNCGIRNRPVEIDRVLPTGIRCTVQINPKDYGKPGHMQGQVVSPAAPREDNGTYWGYTTRLAASIKDVFDECPYEDGYDLKIGTSERGSVSIEEKDFRLPTFSHSLVVFGGVAGIEECVDADETLKLPGSKSNELFDLWLNTCPFQGSRTIRTEEAVLISLSALAPHIAKNKPKIKPKPQEAPKVVAFSDSSPSEESSDSDTGDGGDSSANEGED